MFDKFINRQYARSSSRRTAIARSAPRSRGKLASLLLGIALLVLTRAVASGQLYNSGAPEPIVQTGPGWVSTMALSPDGKILASAGLGSAIKLWDAKKGREIRTLVADARFINSIAFSPDSQFLANGDVGPSAANKGVEVWDVKTGKRVQKLLGHTDKVVAVAFSPDRRRLASGSWDKTIKIWDAATGKELHTLKNQPGILSKVFSAGVSAATGKPTQASKSRATPTWSLAFSPDGQMLASGDDDNTIKLWDPIKGKKLRVLEGHTDYITSVAFSPDGRLLASGSVDGTIKLWDPVKGKLVSTLAGHTKSVNAVTFSPDGQTLASASLDTTIKLWDVRSGREQRTLTGHVNGLHGLVFYPDGRLLVSGGEDSIINIWDWAAGTKLRTLESHSESVDSLSFSPDGQMLLAGHAPGFNKESNQERTLKLWNTPGRELRTLAGHRSAVISAAFSPQGQVVASAGWDKTIKLWEAATGRELRTLAGHAHWINSIAFSPNGKMLASGSGGSEGPTTGFTYQKDNSIKLWDVDTGRLLRTLAGHPIPVFAVAFSPDGRQLASAGNFLPLENTKLEYDVERSAIKVWDVATGNEVLALRGHKLPVKAMTISPDGQWLASSGYDDTVRIWDFKSGRELRLLAEKFGVDSLAFSPDGKILASGNIDRTIKLWDPATGRELRTLKGHSEIVQAVAFSPNGQLLASGAPDGTTRLWDVASGTLLATLMAIDQNDWLVLTPDGLFDGSTNAWREILWRFSQNTFDVLPVEAFFNEFYYPGLLTEILAGKRPQAKGNIAALDRRQPELGLTLAGARPAATGTTPTRNVKVKINVLNALAGARDIRLFRNGSLVKAWRGDLALDAGGRGELEASISIVAGENRLTAYAFNKDNIKSEDALLVIRGDEGLRRKGITYVVEVGINQYANSQYDLKFAAADARFIGEELQRQRARQGDPTDIKIIPLLNQEATKSNILLALKRLSLGEAVVLPPGTPAVLQSLKAAQPEDMVVIYFAGHGTAQENQFYLIPHDLGYDGARAQLDKARLQTILAHSISDRDLEQAVETIDAQALLLIIDACNSGQALEAEEKRRGPMNSKGLAQLAYEKGMYILTAAQSYQAALETVRLGHGYLTYALIEDGLRNAAADVQPRDGQITIREWLDYAVQRVPQVQREDAQQSAVKQKAPPPSPKSTPRKRPRQAGRILDQTPTSASARRADIVFQQPRVFYRREPEEHPVIIARPTVLRRRK